MNVSRSTFESRGCVLTALTVAVLLAGFSVTAWAQTPTPFSLTMRASSSTLEEGATDSASTPDRVALTITRSDPRYSCDHDSDDTTPDVSCPVFNSSPTLKLTATCNGAADQTDCSYSVNQGTTALSDLGGNGATFSFPTVGDDIAKTIELLVSDTFDDGDWNEETVVLTLELDSDVNGADGKTYTTTAKKQTLTIADDDPAPQLKFDKPGIQLAKRNKQTMTVSVDISGTAAAKTAIRTTLNGLSTAGEDDILLSVSPPEAVGSIIKIYDGDTAPQGGTNLDVDRQGRYVVGTIGGTDGVVAATSAGDGIDLTIEAIDVSGFRDEQITLTLMDGRTEAQKRGDGGAIEDSDAATVTILSGEETPTVTFSKSSVSIDEGGKETVHLLADTDQGDQVGSATVSVSGDALVSLQQDGSAISGGAVSFGDSANAEITIVSHSDRDLEDGEEKTATVTITDASGANIGEQRTLTVTVVGSTAVPVLPLVGQLLLALLLTAGGARLYRRRQG